ncbi:MAG: mono/diheme cytochrome c family protein [Candidatus Latescibacterota bacterium]|jgi:mono/diheme cytochrome c family protein
MKALSVIWISGLLLLTLWTTSGHAQFTYDRTTAYTPPPAEDAENLATGKKLYEQKCVWCHGLSGKGDGPAALGMGERGNPKPRDLTKADYKIRSTPMGQLPTDADLFAVMTRGMPGTSMVAFSGLSEVERWQLVYYVKSLSPRFVSEERTPIVIGEAVAPTYESLAKGRWLFANMGCVPCHGAQGRGDGVTASAMVDAQGQPLQPRNLHHGANYRGGDSPRDIYRTLTTGPGGVMPAFQAVLSDEQRWHLANYVHALSQQAPELVTLRQAWFVEDK